MVVVAEIEEVLTEAQKAELDGAIGHINPSCSAVEELMVNQFSIAKQYVVSCVSSDE